MADYIYGIPTTLGPRKNFPLNIYENYLGVLYYLYIEIQYF